MTTKAKICYGWTKNEIWITEDAYLVCYDGYPENIIPLLKRTVEGDIAGKYEHLEHINAYGAVDFIYYVEPCLNEIRCTILEFDWKFYNKYSIDNYKVVKELLL